MGNSDAVALRVQCFNPWAKEIRLIRCLMLYESNACGAFGETRRFVHGRTSILTLQRSPGCVFAIFIASSKSFAARKLVDAAFEDSSGNTDQYARLDYHRVRSTCLGLVQSGMSASTSFDRRMSDSC